MEVAFVTGAGSGIGRASARRLAERGVAVGLFDISRESAEAVAGEIESEGGQAIAVTGDVSKDDDVADAVAVTAERFGGVDLAAACAGIEVTGTVADLELDDWERVIAVNQTGVMLTARHVIPRMLERGSGAFVAIASDAGVLGAAGWTPYCATKHALIGIVRCLAMDFGPKGIRSNVVCPSFVDTPMTDRIFAGIEDERPNWEQRVPLRRFSSPEEVANVVNHLLSSEASYTNGHVYMVDGGETAGLE